MGATAAYLQALLEGVPLPATRDELIAYAEEQDGAAVSELWRLPDREFRSLDEVGEALEPVQARHEEAVPEQPPPWSGEPPGREAYTAPSRSRCGRTV